MSDKFRCEHCGGTFDNGWSDEDAHKEARENFSEVEIDKGGGLVTLCDDCFESCMNWLKAHPEVRIQ